MKMIFHRMAAKELREATGWYSTRNVDVANRFQVAVDRAISRILQDPEALPVELQHIRWIRVSRFPYRLIFERLEVDLIMILAVAHTSRRSRYWRRRS